MGWQWLGRMGREVVEMERRVLRRTWSRLLRMRMVARVRSEVSRKTGGAVDTAVGPTEALLGRLSRPALDLHVDGSHGEVGILRLRITRI